MKAAPITKRQITITLPNDVFFLLEEMCFFDSRNKSREITHLIELYAKNSRLKKQHETVKEYLTCIAALQPGPSMPKPQGVGVEAKIIQFPGRSPCTA
jgi:hypothetical protein